jgi:uncharacterized protein YjiS (DUF1127 family)
MVRRGGQKHRFLAQRTLVLTPLEAPMTRSTAPHLAPASPSLVARAGRGIVRRIVDLARAFRDRQEVKRLVEMDDRALKDIGLLRSDVDGALAEPLFRNPSAVLLRTVERRSRIDAPARAAKPVRPVVRVVREACCA